MNPNASLRAGRFTFACCSSWASSPFCSPRSSISYPDADIAHYGLLLGLIFLTVALVAWRSAYEWIIGRELFRERVYVLGAGERARSIVELLQTRKDAGMQVVGWDGVLADKAERKEAFNAALERFPGRSRLSTESSLRSRTVVANFRSMNYSSCDSMES